MAATETKEQQMEAIQQVWKTNKPSQNTPKDMLDLLAKLK